jgi:glycosyltransferase involved in cell wall biosynthesis
MAKATARNFVDELRRRRVLRRRRPPEFRETAGPGSGTTYYLCPDHPVPSGGVRVIYRHVDVLNEAGRRAAVLHHTAGFRCSWFENRTRVVGAPEVELGSTDVLVVPEIYGPFLGLLPKGPRRVAFNQNGYLTFEHLLPAQRPAYDIFEAAMTVSEDSAELLRLAFPGLPVSVVPNSVDTTVFHPAAAVPDRRLALMPRKRAADADLILRLLGERPAGWEVTPIEGVAEEEAAAALRSAPIFLALGFREGFGLPVAEAMASGCFVVGFHGFGGREIFDPRFSVAVEDGDVLGAAKAVAAACDRFEADAVSVRADGARAAASIGERYSPENQAASLLAFFDALG